MGCLFWIVGALVVAALAAVPVVGPVLAITAAGVMLWLLYMGSKMPDDEVEGRQPPMQLVGARTAPVVGTGHYRGWGRTRGANPVTLVREPRNQYDPNAVAVHFRGSKIGHLSREVAASAGPSMDAAGVGTAETSADFSDRTVRVALPTIVAPSLAPAIDPDSLRPAIPWGRPCVELEVSYESDHRQEVAAIFQARGIVLDTVDGTVLKDAAAHLVPSHDPRCPAVLVDGQWVGNLTGTEAEVYARAVDQLADRGDKLETVARVWAIADHGTVRARVILRVPVIGEIGPPGPLPNGAHVLLPHGSTIQVTGEENYLADVVALLNGQPSQPAVATLHVAPIIKSGAKERIEVRVYGATVGHLTPYMSEHFLPLVKLCDEEGVTVACAAMVKGNQIKADVVLDATKAGELNDDWIRDNVYGSALDDTRPE